MHESEKKTVGLFKHTVIPQFSSKFVNLKAHSSIRAWSAAQGSIPVSVHLVNYLLYYKSRLTTAITDYVFEAEITQWSQLL